MIAANPKPLTAATIDPCKLIAVVFLIAIQFSPIFAEGSLVQNGLDGFFGWIGKSIRGFVGDDFSDSQTDQINNTIDSGVEAGSIAVTMWRIFHDFVVNIILLIGSLMGVQIDETIAFVIGAVITLFIVGMILKHFFKESWKIVFAILAFIAFLMFLGVTYIGI